MDSEKGHDELLQLMSRMSRLVDTLVTVCAHMQLCVSSVYVCAHNAQCMCVCTCVLCVCTCVLCGVL